jgi:O-antigen/teichoic acid export membrane protein
LLPWLALFTLLTMPRVVFSKVLQSNFRMKEIFFIDFSNFGVAAITVFVLLTKHEISSAQDVIRITVLTGLLSSIVATILVRPYLNFRLRYSRDMLSRISYFVRYQAAMGLTSAFQQNFDTLVVAPFTNAAGVAIYTGAKMLLRGFDVIRETMTLFVFPAASKYYSRGEMQTLRSIVEKSTSLLYLALIPIGIVLEIFAPTIFHLLYGSKFDASVPLFRILLVVLIVFPVQMVFATTLSGMGKIKEMFRFFVIGLLTNAIVAVVLLSTIGISGAAIAFVVAGATIATQMFFYMRKHVGFSVANLFKRGFLDSVRYLQAMRGARS